MKNQLLTFPQWERFFGGGGGVVCFWLGNVKNFFENVLLAGEMLKSEKPTFNISPGGVCASGWGNVKNFFENVLLAGEILKKLKC